MSAEEMLERYRNHNSDLAKALNEKKIMINDLTETIIAMQRTALKSDTRQLRLKFELDEKTRQNEQLMTELSDHQQKSKTWQNLITDLVQCNTAKYVHIMRFIGLMPPAVQDATPKQATIVQNIKSDNESIQSAKVDNVELTDVKSEIPVEESELSDVFSEMTIKSSRKPTIVLIDDSSFTSEKNLSHKNESTEISIKLNSFESINNITMRRHTKDKSSDEDMALIQQINESLEQLDGVVNSSTLKMDVDDQNIQNDKEASPDTMNDSVWSTMKSDIEKSTEPEHSEVNKMTSTTPTIMVTACATSAMEIKRKSDEMKLRVPKKSMVKPSVLTQNNKPTPFTSKSPKRLSSEHRESLSDTNRLSKSLDNIFEQSTVKSPKKRFDNKKIISNNVNTIKSTQSPSYTPKRKHNEKKGKTTVIDKPSQDVEIENIDPNHMVHASGRPSRRAAPTDLREPVLKSKMRRIK